MSTDAISLAVWDVPMPAVAGEAFSIKIGATAAAGKTIEVRDGAGQAIASGMPGTAQWPGTEALHWLALDVPAPEKPGVAEYAVQCGGAETCFSVAIAAKPEHTLSVSVTERDTKEPLGDVEIRLGPFHARTGQDGRAELRVATGDYQLQLWRTAHIAQPQPISIAADASVALTMLNVPEEHPDARWVR